MPPGPSLPTALPVLTLFAAVDANSITSEIKLYPYALPGPRVLTVPLPSNPGAYLTVFSVDLRKHPHPDTYFDSDDPYPPTLSLTLLLNWLAGIIVR